MAVSPDVEQAAEDKLTRWIDLEKRVVSYRELARELGVNINVAKNLMHRHFQENPNLFPTYLMTGTYLPSIKSLELTQTQTATQHLAASTPAEPSASADSMQIDNTQESAPGMDDDDGKKPTKAQQLLDESKPEIGMKGGAEGWPLRDEDIVTRGLLLVGGREEMEGTVRDQRSAMICADQDPSVYLSSTVRLRAIPRYNNAETYGTITGSFEMAKAKPTGKPTKPLAKPPVAKPTMANAFAKPAAASKTATTAATTEKAKPTVKATKKIEDDEPMLKPGKLSARSSKRVIRSESPEEEEEPAKRKTVAGKQKVVQDSMPTNTSAKPLQDLDVAEQDRLAMEAMMDMSDNFDMPSSSAIAQPMEQDQDDEPTTSGKEQRTLQDTKIGQEGKVLKKRRTTKSVEVKNKRGFTYYEDVSTDEEYWSDGTTTASASTAQKGKKPATKTNSLKRNASTTSVSTKGDDADSQSESQGTAAGKKAPMAKTKAGAAVTGGLKTGGTGKTSAAGGKAAPKKAAGQQSMLSFFKKQ
ncbi:hypothetical protein QFC21_001026 [Naganishia friedmannii]|uniref:Uncharacterized protein n=1 Tax=Naganishia friedmannii TaxID=89922 RepID=A0ACC2WAE4_9TREE|nr:hypothetical protein QFC21_001026 [Naganishia friedmannii]